MKPKPLLPLLAALAPAPAAAHVFAQPYFLPVPFGYYAAGATAVLLASFVLVGLFAALPRLAGRAGGEDAAPIVRPPAAPSLRRIGRGLAMLALAACIVTGLGGTQNAFENLNMTLFWIVFVLAVPYASAFAGDFYAAINPWRTLVELVEGALGAPFRGRARDAQRVGHAPAIVLYMAFIWLELFGQLLPRGLSVALAAYTLVNIAGAWWLGTEAWFRQGEFFGVMFSLLARMAPRGRAPLAGLIDEPVERTSLLVFILFMLSSTAFDGLHSTQTWAGFFWKDVYPTLAAMLPTPDGRARVVLAAQLYYGWQWGTLLVSPFVYLAIYAGFVAAVKAITRSPRPLAELMLRFAGTLVPIAFVYHVTHYYTLLLTQGPQVVRLVSDPFGIGWNLFGTAHWRPWAVMVGMDTLWLTQIGLILGGHVVGVWLAHLEALRGFGSARRAALSQVPMLLLMVAFTNFGLWILSLPIAPGG